MRWLLVLLLLIQISCARSEAGDTATTTGTRTENSEAGNPKAGNSRTDGSQKKDSKSEPAKTLRWQTMPDLPNSVGVAGAFAGTHGDVLMVAGGASFPNGMPWRGGEKVYHDAIHVWDGERWQTPDQRLAAPLAYGVSISTTGGLLCIGGQNGQRCFSDVFRLRWNPQTRAIERDTWPPLPIPLSCAGGATVTTKSGARITYVVGGQQGPNDSPGNTVLRLQTSGGTALTATAWETLPPMPGPRRGLPVVTALGASLFVFSGRDYGPLRAAQTKFAFHTDWLRLDTQEDIWSKPGSIQVDDVKKLQCVMAGSAAREPGGARILIFGGASGALLQQTLDLEEAARPHFLDHHPGFSRRVLAFDPENGSFTTAGQLHAPHRMPVTTPAVAYRGGIVLASGEVRPGERSPRVWLATPALPAEPPAFGWLNWLTLGVYLLAMVLIGWHCARGIKSTEEFFLAGRRIPWWAAGLSIFGTQLSAVTFMSIPATSFAGDWVRIIGNLMILVTIPLVVWFYLPKLLGLRLATAYEYLGNRFGPRVRQLAAALFVGMQLGRIGIVLYLPSIALAAVTGLDIYACILVMGVLAIVYTALGGMAAVIWTDVVQVFVLLGGAILALVIAINNSGGLSQVLDLSESAGRLRTIQPGTRIDSLTLPVMIVGFLFLNLVPYSSDQAVVQRYMTTANPRQAAASLWANFVLTAPTALIFFSLGTALFVFYSTHPDLPTPSKNDQIVPWFVVHELPAGLAGIVIAAIFAASMSSLDSSMNSVSTVVVYDFLHPRGSDGEDIALLRAGRTLTVLIGILGIGTACWMAAVDVYFVFDTFNKVLGMFGGPLAALFFLGVMTRKVQSKAAIGGALTGAALVGGLQFLSLGDGPPIVHPFLFAAVGFLTTVVIGLLLQALLRSTSEPATT